MISPETVSPITHPAEELLTSSPDLSGGANPYGLSTPPKTQPVGIALNPPAPANTATVAHVGSDFNNDGQVDVLWRHTQDGRTALWHLAGDQLLNSNDLLTTNPIWEAAAMADMNGDGQSDILWRNQVTGRNSVWLMQDTQVVGMTDFQQVANVDWQLRGVADFNQDGHVDLLWRNQKTGRNSIWLMRGLTQTGAYLLPTVNPDWQIVGMGDMNQDGQSDILWRNQINGRNSVWMMDQHQQASIASLQTVSNPDWEIQGTGDFNGDQHTDLLWRNRVSGRNSFWYLEDMTLIAMGQQVLSGMNDPNWQPLAVAQSGAVNSPPAIIPDPTTTPDDESGFDIEFDYRFDTQGWFTPEKRALLETAADILETLILDEFQVTPTGTVTPFVINPQTGEYVSSFVTDKPIDDVLIFVGARELGTSLGLGGSSGWHTNETRYVGDDFEPWIGSLAFDTTTNWYFDATPGTRNDIPLNSYDFLSVAIHEIIHALGWTFGIAAFDALVSTGSSTFTGVNAKAVNHGNPLPLSADKSHVLSGYSTNQTGEAAMDPELTNGQRKLPTAIDVAVLDDIGYQINYDAVYQNS